MTDSLQPLLIAMSTFVIGHFVLASLPVRHAMISMIGLTRLAMGIALYALLLMGHEWAIGVSPMPMG